MREIKWTWILDSYIIQNRSAILKATPVNHLFGKTLCKIIDIILL